MAAKGDHGSDGFVACLSKSGEALIWIATFDCTGPFEHVYIGSGVIEAVTSSGTLWRFPIDDPTSVRVETP